MTWQSIDVSTENVGQTVYNGWRLHFKKSASELSEKKEIKTDIQQE